MRTIEDQITIQCSREALFDYLKQPWLWHEWHPNSVEATSSASDLQPGDTFREGFKTTLFGFFPIRRTLNYSVLKADYPHHWEIEASTNDAHIHFEYILEELEDGVRFTRKLNYQITGFMRVFSSFLFRKNQRVSKMAMQNLKRQMETPKT